MCYTNIVSVWDVIRSSFVKTCLALRDCTSLGLLQDLKAGSLGVQHLCH